MSPTLDQLYSQARSLPPADRAALAGRLLNDLEGPADSGVEEAWLAEIDHRLDAYDRGEVQAIAASDVLHLIKTRTRG